MIGESEDETTEFIDMLSDAEDAWICVGCLDKQKQIEQIPC
jgi:hypothetical protein